MHIFCPIQFGFLATNNLFVFMIMTDLGFLTVILKSDSDLRQSFILNDLMYGPYFILYIFADIHYSRFPMNVP